MPVVGYMSPNHLYLGSRISYNDFGTSLALGKWGDSIQLFDELANLGEIGDDERQKVSLTLSNN